MVFAVSGGGFSGDRIIAPRGAAIDWNPNKGPFSLRGVYVASSGSGALPENQHAHRILVLKFRKLKEERQVDLRNPIEGEWHQLKAQEIAEQIFETVYDIGIAVETNIEGRHGAGTTT